MATGIFAGIPVNDYARALEWYQQVLGAEPSFCRGGVAIGRGQLVYIIVDASRAGGAVNMIWFDDPAATVTSIQARGLEPTEIEKHDPGWKYAFHGPDGNEIGIGGNIYGSD